MNTDVSHADFICARSDFESAYLVLQRTGELQRRAVQAVAALADCHVCPRNCGVDRLADETAVCKSGRFARVASAFPHMGEETCLRGHRGSGTIFFSYCNLRCVFCQNYDVSQEGAGVEVTASELAELMLVMQARGCHNINFVTPEHVVPQLLEALVLAVQDGLSVPLVYNTSAYDSRHSLRLLDGVVDIYMPDFKFWDANLSLRYLKAKDYPQTARAALREMHRQVGELVVDEQGLALRGVLVRHLVMPGLNDETDAILRFLATEISPDTYLNLMDQYYPAGKVRGSKYGEINRRVHRDEYHAALRTAKSLGLWRLDGRISQ